MYNLFNVMFNEYAFLVSFNRFKALRDQKHSTSQLMPLMHSAGREEDRHFSGKTSITQVRLTDLQACQEIFCDQVRV